MNINGINDIKIKTYFPDGYATPNTTEPQAYKILIDQLQNVTYEDIFNESGKVIITDALKYEELKTSLNTYVKEQELNLTPREYSSVFSASQLLLEEIRISLRDTIRQAEREADTGTSTATEAEYDNVIRGFVEFEREINIEPLVEKVIAEKLEEKKNTMSPEEFNTFLLQTVKESVTEILTEYKQTLTATEFQRFMTDNTQEILGSYLQGLRDNMSDEKFKSYLTENVQQVIAQQLSAIKDALTSEQYKAYMQENLQIVLHEQLDMLKKRMNVEDFEEYVTKNLQLILATELQTMKDTMSPDELENYVLHILYGIVEQEVKGITITMDIPELVRGAIDKAVVGIVDKVQDMKSDEAWVAEIDKVLEREAAERLSNLLEEEWSTLEKSIDETTIYIFKSKAAVLLDDLHAVNMLHNGTLIETHLKYMLDMAVNSDEVSDVLEAVKSISYYTLVNSKVKNSGDIQRLEVFLQLVDRLNNDQIKDLIKKGIVINIDTLNNANIIADNGGIYLVYDSAAEAYALSSGEKTDMAGYIWNGQQFFANYQYSTVPENLGDGETLIKRMTYANPPMETRGYVVYWEDGMWVRGSK